MKRHVKIFPGPQQAIKKCETREKILSTGWELKRHQKSHLKKVKCSKPTKNHNIYHPHHYHAHDNVISPKIQKPCYCYRWKYPCKQEMLCLQTSHINSVSLNTKLIQNLFSLFQKFSKLYIVKSMVFIIICTRNGVTKIKPIVCLRIRSYPSVSTLWKEDIHFWISAQFSYLYL